MGQAGLYLRKTTDGYTHWCPACREVHWIPSRWQFDGNLAAPTFSPSVRITGKKAIHIDGRWTGDWELDENGKAKDSCCHYILTAGVINFCGDCTHELRGLKIAIPPLPDFLTDDLLDR